ncbi:LacI family DNA-binding transcriptional regulator [Reichenbachiella versicolor]|uniref:LacI family DNA-binding transcriptional regulator n=1 Tax=Reichenbachiella versicolor TaxID=1821036 RepID=UPI000D6E3CB0|nr:LacI family DNA-binding transcriptional regulator [Reichenbachiella versicolor]
MSKDRVSIKDLAKALGVSTSTVSRALSNEGRIGAKTKASVLELAEKWGYKPNPFAANLSKKKTGLIGLILPQFTHHYFARVLSGINEVVNKTDFNLIINVHEGSLEREREIISMLRSMRVDGVIASLARESSEFNHYLDLIEDDTPLVFVDRMCEDLDVSYVISDDFTGCLKVVDALAREGRNKIGYVSGPMNLSTSFTRKVGYHEGLKRNSLPFDQKWEISIDEIDWLDRIIRLIKEGEIEAVMTYSDYQAFEVIERLKSENIAVPDQVSVVGFADEPIALHMSPKLSTVEQPDFRMGVRSAEILLSHINGQIELIQEEMKTELVLRESTLSIKEKLRLENAS